MYTIDLQKTGKNKLRQLVAERVGHTESGLFTKWVSKGVSGFEFVDKVGESDITYNVILEIFPDGLGFYCRNRYYNFLILLPYSEIESMHVVKNADVVNHAGFSWFTILTRLGFSYWKAKRFLLEQELIVSYPLTVTLHSNKKETLHLTCKLSNLEKIHTFFLRLPLKDNLYISIETFVK